MNIRQRLNQPSTGPARGTGRPVFTNFRPTHYWRCDEDGSAVLVLSLPGFTREHIKVTAELSDNVRVHGLRHVGNKNWSLFNSDFQVPEDCSIAGIRAKYDNGSLCITFPKKNPRKTPKEVTSAETELPHPSPPSKPSVSQPAHTLSPPKQSAPQPPLPPSLPIIEQIQPLIPNVPSQLKEQERPPQPDIQPKAQTPANIPGVETNEMPFGSHYDPPSIKPFSANREELKDWETTESLAGKILKGGTEKGNEPSASARSAEEMEHERKEQLDNRARETEALIGTRLSSGFKLEDYMKHAHEKMSGERRTLVNIGAAVLVIADLGIYVCCKIGGKINS